MTQRCSDCGRVYDDAAQWTPCPHGPLWAAPTSYCPTHDLVDCPFHRPETATRPMIQTEKTVRFRGIRR